MCAYEYYNIIITELIILGCTFNNDNYHCRMFNFWHAEIEINLLQLLSLLNVQPNIINSVIIIL